MQGLLEIVVQCKLQLLIVHTLGVVPATEESKHMAIKLVLALALRIKVLEHSTWATGLVEGVILVA